MSAWFLDPDCRAVDDDELCEPQGPVGEDEYASIEAYVDDGLDYAEDDEDL